MGRFGVGQGLRRVEDLRFLTGHGRYSDDIQLEGQTYGVPVRSPFAHAEIKSIDLEEAKAVLDRLVALERADSNGKFTVVDPFGARFEFTARGVTGSLDRMVRRCTPRS